MFLKFPSTFSWGAASSGPQHEGASDLGGREPSIWDKYYQMSPHRFFEGIGPQQCGDFYHRFREDLQLAKDMGLTSYRTSIQWSRFMPYMSDSPNDDALRFYHEVIDTMLELEIEPYINLHHFDLPWSYQEKGGWENRETIVAYQKYAEQCFKHFGDKINKWFTFNEPIVVPYIAYIGDYLYPNVMDMQRAMTVAYHTSLAHAQAVETFRNNGYEGQIGIILNIAPSYPRSSHPEDVKAAHLADLFHNESFKMPSLKGIYSEELIKFMHDHQMPLPVQSDDAKILSHGVVDQLGINYYMPQRVKAKEHLPNPNAPIHPGMFYDLYDMPGKRFNPHRGWEIYPEGLYDCLIDIRDNYGNIPTFISENGMGVENESRFRNEIGFIDDQYRIDFIQDHLYSVHKAIQEGCNCQAYHLWTLIDNWSWQNAYKNRYGYVELDYATQKRTIKKSGHWIREVSTEQGFEYNRPYY